MINRTIIIIVVAIGCLAIIVTAMSYIGDHEATESLGIFVNRTTKDEILKRFGKPNLVKIIFTGEEWQYEDFKMTLKGKEKSGTCTIAINRKGLVVGSYFVKNMIDDRNVKKLTEQDKKFMQSKASGYSKKGVNYVNANKPEKAIEEFTRSLEVFPEYAPTYSKLGYAYYCVNNYDEAIKNYEKALSLDPDIFLAVMGIGRVYFSQNLYEKSAPYFERSIKINTRADAPYMYLGLVRVSQKRHKDAISLFKKVIDLVPKYARAYFELARCYERLGDNDLAIANYEKGLTLDPRFIPAYMKLANIYVLKHDASAAYEVIKRGRKADPNDAEIIKASVALQAAGITGGKSSPTVLPAAAFQDRRGESMEMVDFKPIFISYPFTVKYPAQWYAREEKIRMPSSQIMFGLFLSREPVHEMADRYKVGMGLYYRPDYFIQLVSPDSTLGKTAKVVIKVVDWEKTKQGFIEELAKEGQTVISQTDITFGGYSTFRVEYKSSLIHCIAYYIKAGKDLITMGLEAPPEEFFQYEDVFKNIVESFTFNADYKAVDERSVLAAKTLVQ